MSAAWPLVPISAWLGPGILYPQACTSQVPAQTLALPAVRRALDRQHLAVITEVSRARDAGELLRRDLAAAIAAAERRAFDRLIAQQARQRGEVEKPRREFFWSAERLEWLRGRLAAVQQCEAASPASSG